MKHILFLFVLFFLYSAVLSADETPPPSEPAAGTGLEPAAEAGFEAAETGSEPAEAGSEDAAALPAKRASLFNWAFQTVFGITVSQTREYVYEGDKCISRLDWIEKTSPDAAFSASLSLFNITARFELSLSVPVKNGVMEDYDFLIAGSDSPSLYSRHDAYLDKNFTCRAELGYVFKIKALRLNPALGICYENRKWTAADGYLQYPAGGGAWTGSESKENVYGSVVSYEQMIWYPSISFAVIYIINQYIDVSFLGKFYPYMETESIDSHFLRSPPVRFYDTMKGGIGGMFALQAAFSPSKGMAAFVFALVCEALSAAKGESASGTIGRGTGALVRDENCAPKMERGAFAASFGIRMRG